MGEMVLRFVEGTVCVNTGGIVYIESYRHRIVFHMTDGIYHIYKPLGEIEDMLSTDDFICIHKSYIIGLRYVRAVSGYRLTLEDGTVLPVPKGRYKEVKSRIVRQTARTISCI